MTQDYLTWVGSIASKYYIYWSCYQINLGICREIVKPILYANQPIEYPLAQFVLEKLLSIHKVCFVILQKIKDADARICRLDIKLLYKNNTHGPDFSCPGPVAQE